MKRGAFQSHALVILCLLTGCHRESMPASVDISDKGSKLSHLWMVYSESYGHYPSDPAELVKSGAISKKDLDELLSIHDAQGPGQERKWFFTPGDAEVLMYASQPAKYTNGLQDLYKTEDAWVVYSKRGGGSTLKNDETPASQSDVVRRLLSARVLGIYAIASSDIGEHILKRVKLLKGDPAEEVPLEYYNPNANTGDQVMYAYFKWPGGGEECVHWSIQGDNMMWLLLKEQKSVPLPISEIEQALAPETRR